MRVLAVELWNLGERLQHSSGTQKWEKRQWKGKKNTFTFYMSPLPQASTVQCWKWGLWVLHGGKREQSEHSTFSAFQGATSETPFCHVSPRTLRESARLDQLGDQLRTKKRGGGFHQVYTDLNSWPANASSKLPLNPWDQAHPTVHLGSRHTCGPHQWAHTESLARLTGGRLSLTKPVWKDWKRRLLFQMCRHQCKVQGSWRKETNTTKGIK